LIAIFSERKQMHFRKRIGSFKPNGNAVRSNKKTLEQMLHVQRRIKKRSGDILLHP
jgi:hypothetical protein